MGTFVFWTWQGRRLIRKDRTRNTAGIVLAFQGAVPRASKSCARPERSLEMTVRHLLLLFLLLALMLNQSPLAQIKVRQAGGDDALATYEIRGDAGTVTIPVELVARHVLIPVSLNGSKPFRLVLDTGMPDGGGILLWDTPRVEALGLESMDTAGMMVRVAGAGKGQEPVAPKIATGIEAAAGDLRLKEMRALVVPAMTAAAPHFDGVIGRAIFGSFAVKIDYVNERVTLWEPERFTPPEGTAGLPLTFSHGIPSVTASVTPSSGMPVPVRLHVDTGAAHPISLSPDAEAGLVPPAGAIETILGRGMGGDLTGRLARIRSLELGGITLEDVVATFPDSGQMPHGENGPGGNLGDDVLRRFDVVFDYAGKTMYLEPNDTFDEPFEWDATGIVLSRDEPVDLKIRQVIPASPAAEAGLMVGDILTSINGAPASEYTHAGLTELFRRPGSEVRLVARRGQKEIEVTLTLRRLV
jgi:hypothetical protein